MNAISKSLGGVLRPNSLASLQRYRPGTRISRRDKYCTAGTRDGKDSPNRFFQQPPLVWCHGFLWMLAPWHFCWMECDGVSICRGTRVICLVLPDYACLSYRIDHNDYRLLADDCNASIQPTRFGILFGTTHWFVLACVSSLIQMCILLPALRLFSATTCDCSSERALEHCSCYNA